MKMKLLALSGIVLLVAGCASTPSSESYRMKLPDPMISTSGDYSPSIESPRAAPIDYLGLQGDLGLTRSSQELGYDEKAFDTCHAGFGFPSSQDCHREYFVVIHFQLLCRDSEGTLSRSLSAEDMRPISGRVVNWKLKGADGVVHTDSSGYGQIRTVASTSQRVQRLKLTVGSEFLYMRAGEITRVVTPQPWCNP